MEKHALMHWTLMDVWYVLGHRWLQNTEFVKKTDCFNSQQCWVVAYSFVSDMPYYIPRRQRGQIPKPTPSPFVYCLQLKLPKIRHVSTHKVLFLLVILPWWLGGRVVDWKQYSSCFGGLNPAWGNIFIWYHMDPLYIQSLQTCVILK